jgi:hypothetical protein
LILPTVPLGFVLRLAFRYRLPLHVAGAVGSPAFEWLHMIDDVAGTRAAAPARRWAGLLALKGVFSPFASLDSALAVPLYAAVTGTAISGVIGVRVARAVRVDRARRSAVITVRPRVIAVIAGIAVGVAPAVPVRAVTRTVTRVTVAASAITKRPAGQGENQTNEACAH